jgi:hypothetical protein
VRAYVLKKRNVNVTPLFRTHSHSRDHTTGVRVEEYSKGRTRTISSTCCLTESLALLLTHRTCPALRKSPRVANSSIKRQLRPRKLSLIRNACLKTRIQISSSFDKLTLPNLDNLLIDRRYCSYIVTENVTPALAARRRLPVPIAIANPTLLYARPECSQALLHF